MPTCSHDSVSTNSAYSNYSSVTSPVSGSRGIANASGNQPGGPYGFVPTLLYNPSALTPTNTPSISRIASPIPTQGQTQATYHPFSAQEPTPASSHLSRSFRCPTPSRNKSFGQVNTLSYRATHGHCDFFPSEDSETPQGLVVEKEVANGVQNLSPQCVNVISASSSSAQEHAPTSQSPLSRVLTRPDKLHPTLTCWVKNINKQTNLIVHLQELASSAPADHRSHLLRQVVALRTTSKKQREHCLKFLTLSEECVNRYLLDISAEIQRQRSFLDKLEGRLETASKLRREAVDLKLLYESGTVATMKDLRTTGKAALLSSPEAKY